MTLKFEDMLVKHSYYCSESNYFSTEASGRWETWSDFYDEFADADIDMNLIFRWDIHKREKSNRYYMEVFMIHQRKGIFSPHHIALVDERDMPTIVDLLSKHHEYLMRLWLPFKHDNTGEIL